MLHDILVDLLPKVDLRVRRQLSEQLRAMQKPPPELLSLLVHDVIEVSGPLLEHAEVSDEDLIDVVKVGDDAQREKIARRPHLAPQVREALEKLRSKNQDDTKDKPPLKEVPGANPAKPAAVTPQAPNLSAVRKRHGKTQLFEDIIRSAVDWTWETGRDFKITSLSNSAIRAFGRPTATMTGRDFVDYCALANNASRYETMQDVLDQKRPFRNLIILTRDAIEQQRTWRLSGVPCFDLYTGRFIGFRGTAQETTAGQATSVSSEPMAASEDLNKKKKVSPAGETDKVTEPPAALEILIPPVARNIDKNAAEMIQTLSHELRTPLNAILGFSEMIDHEAWGPVSEKYHDKTKTILRSAHNLKNVITDVLDVAKIRAGKQYVAPRFFSLATVLRTSLEAVEKEAVDYGVTLSPLTLAPDVPMLNDPDYLGRCIIKLLTYIMMHASDGGNLWITARRTTDHRVNIDIPLLGPHTGEKPMPGDDKSADIIDQGVSLAFGLSVAADLATAIGGEIRLIIQDNQAKLLRLTIGDYPAGDPTGVEE